MGEKVLTLGSHYLEGKRKALSGELLAWFVLIVLGSPTLPFALSLPKLPVLLMVGAYMGDSFLGYLGEHSTLTMLHNDLAKYTAELSQLADSLAAFQERLDLQVANALLSASPVEFADHCDILEKALEEQAKNRQTILSKDSFVKIEQEVQGYLRHYHPEFEFEDWLVICTEDTYQECFKGMEGHQKQKHEVSSHPAEESKEDQAA